MEKSIYHSTSESSKEKICKCKSYIEIRLATTFVQVTTSFVILRALHFSILNGLKMTNHHEGQSVSEVPGTREMHTYSGEQSHVFYWKYFFSHELLMCHCYCLMSF